MENWTVENFEIVGLGMLKMAYNFWPVILFMIAYCIWEHLVYNTVPQQAKSKSAKTPDQKPRDRGMPPGRQHH